MTYEHLRIAAGILTYYYIRKTLLGRGFALRQYSSFRTQKHDRDEIPFSSVSTIINHAILVISGPHGACLPMCVTRFDPVLNQIKVNLSPYSSDPQHLWGLLILLIQSGSVTLKIWIVKIGKRWAGFFWIPMILKLEGKCCDLFFASIRLITLKQRAKFFFFVVQIETLFWLIYTSFHPCGASCDKLVDELTERTVNISCDSIQGYTIPRSFLSVITQGANQVSLLDISFE